MKLTYLLAALGSVAVVAASQAKPTAGAHAAIRRRQLTGAALASAEQSQMDSYANSVDDLHSSLASVDVALISSYRAGTATRSTSAFQTATSVPCPFPADDGRCCPGGDIIDGICYANGSNQDIESKSDLLSGVAAASATGSSASSKSGAVSLGVNAYVAAPMALAGLAGALAIFL